MANEAGSLSNDVSARRNEVPRPWDSGHLVPPIIKKVRNEIHDWALLAQLGTEGGLANEQELLTVYTQASAVFTEVNGVKSDQFTKAEQDTLECLVIAKVFMIADRYNEHHDNKFRAADFFLDLPTHQKERLAKAFIAVAAMQGAGHGNIFGTASEQARINSSEDSLRRIRYVFGNALRTNTFNWEFEEHDMSIAQNVVSADFANYVAEALQELDFAKSRNLNQNSLYKPETTFPELINSVLKMKTADRGMAGGRVSTRTGDLQLPHVVAHAEALAKAAALGPPKRRDFGGGVLGYIKYQEAMRAYNEKQSTRGPVLLGSSTVRRPLRQVSESIKPRDPLEELAEEIRKKGKTTGVPGFAYKVKPGAHPQALEIAMREARRDSAKKKPSAFNASKGPPKPA